MISSPIQNQLQRHPPHPHNLNHISLSSIHPTLQWQTTRNTLTSMHHTMHILVLKPLATSAQPPINRIAPVVQTNAINGRDTTTIPPTKTPLPCHRTGVNTDLLISHHPLISTRNRHPRMGMLKQQNHCSGNLLLHKTKTTTTNNPYNTTQPMSPHNTKRCLPTQATPIVPTITLQRTACRNSTLRQTPPMSQRTQILPYRESPTPWPPTSSSFNDTSPSPTNRTSTT